MPGRRGDFIKPALAARPSAPAVGRPIRMVTMDISRRGFLSGSLKVTAAVAAATTFVGFAAVPKLWGDGIHDDTAALNAFFRGEQIEHAGAIVALRSPDGFVFRGGRYLISDTVYMQGDFDGHDVWFLRSSRFPADAPMISSKGTAHVGGIHLGPIIGAELVTFTA